jgi:hypothetical protein
VGFGTPVPLLVGIVLILIGIGLFFLDTFKPGYKRDSDTVYAFLFMGVGILSLLIWNAGFAEALQLMVSAGTLIALMIERIQNRTANADPLRQMGSRAPRRESDRPSRAYRNSYDDMPRSDLRVELDEDEFISPIDEPAWSRRIPGSREERGSSRNSYEQSAYVDQLADNTRQARPSSRRSSSAYEDEGQYAERSRRRPLQLEGDVVDSSYDDAPLASMESSRRRRDRSADVPADETMPSSSRSRRRRGRASNGDRPTDGDYVDYKPLNSSPKPSRSDDEFDNSNNFDDGPEFR